MNKPFIEIDAEHFTLSAFETKPIEGMKHQQIKKQANSSRIVALFIKAFLKGLKVGFQSSRIVATNIKQWLQNGGTIRLIIQELPKR